jgi:hypothetical protein
MNNTKKFHRAILVWAALLAISGPYQPAADAQEKNPKLDTNPLKLPPTIVPLPNVVIKGMAEGKGLGDGNVEIKVQLHNQGVVEARNISVFVMLVGFTKEGKPVGELGCGENTLCLGKETVDLLPAGKSNLVIVKFKKIDPVKLPSQNAKLFSTFQYRAQAGYQIQPTRQNKLKEVTNKIVEFYAKHPLPLAFRVSS